MTSSFSAWTETTLGGIRMLKGVPADVLLDLGAHAEWCRYPVGERLLVGRRAAAWLAFLTAGLVEMRMETGERAEYGAGATLGLRRAFAKSCPGYTVVTTSPVTIAWLHKDDLTDAMTRSPPLALAVARSLAERSQDLLPRMDDRHDLDHRVAEALIVAVARYLRPDGFATLPTLPDHSLWAALLGVSAADVRRSFARLARASLVRTVAGERMYVDVGRLRARLAQRKPPRRAADDD